MGVLHANVGGVGWPFARLRTCRDSVKKKSCHW